MISTSKPTALVILSLSLSLFLAGQSSAGVNFVDPGVAGSVTNLSVGGVLYDVAFAGNISHASWVNQLDFSSEAEAQDAIVALAAALNAAGATTTRYTTAGGGTFDFTTGQLWYAANATTLFGETLIRNGSNWQLANPLMGGSNAPINGAFPFALDFSPASGATWTDLGFGLAGVNGVPVLAGTGTLAAGSAGSVALTSAKASSLAVLFLSLTNTPTPFKGGTLVPVPVLLSLSLGTDASGELTVPFVWPVGIASGVSVYSQYAIQDPAAVLGVALSNALESITP